MGSWEFKPGVLLVIVIGAVLLLALNHHSTSLAAGGTDPTWDEAVNRREANKPTVVFFTATWCPYCQEFSGGVLAHAEVQDFISHHYNFYVVEITVPGGATRSSKFGVNSFPTLIRYDVNGNETSRLHNSSQEQFIDWLKAGE